MTYRCCLCDPAGKVREGRIPDGGGVPLCAEHRAQTYWSSRQPKLSTTNARPMSVVEQAFAYAMLGAAHEAA